MKFTGQVKIPEVDHPGVPAIFQIDDGQAEVLLEGESLGRWSLFDVHASRLVSSAFSIKLGDDEITFLADEPVDFAYKGVEHMAEEWARYKTMTFPRRVVAVKRSRSGTVASRIPELREVMLLNLSGGTVSSRRREAASSIRMTEHERPRPTITERIAATSELPASPAESSPRPPERVDEAEPSEMASSGVAEAAKSATDAVLPAEPPAPEVAEPDPDSTPEPSRPRLLPGPGLVGRHVAASRAAEADSGPTGEPKTKTRPKRGAKPVPVEEPQPAMEPEPVVEPAARHAEDLEPVRAEEDVPAEVAQLIGASAAGDNGESAGGLIVDLGRFEDVETQPVVAEGREPALTGAPEAKSGLFGAVRAAFVRSRGPHQHNFVDAPGGLGITRHICEDCGHVSIGTTD